MTPMAPLTIRYNNPGAIEYKPWLEKYGGSRGPNGRYAQFPDAESGYRAMEGLLGAYRDKHGLNSVSGIINRWAPPNVDNNSTAGYVAHVSKALGVAPDAALPAEMTGKLAEAMAAYEAGRPVPRNGGNMDVPNIVPPGARAGMSGVLARRLMEQQQAQAMAQPAVPAALPTQYAGMTPEDIAQARKMSAAMMGDASDASPVQHWTQALARVVQGGVGSMYAEQARQGQADLNKSLVDALSGGGQPDPRQLLANPATRDMGLKMLQSQWAQATPMAQAALDKTRSEAEKNRAQARIAGIKPETAFDVEISKKSAADVEERAKVVASAQQRMQDLRRLGGLIDNPNVYQGSGGEAVLKFKRLGQSLGVAVEGVTASEALASLGNQLALKMRSTAGGEGMPGSLSNQDREFLVSMVPGLGKTREGNRAIVEIMHRAEEYKAKVNGEAIKYINARKSNLGLADYMSEYMKRNPMMTDEMIAKYRGMAGEAPKNLPETVSSMTKAARESPYAKMTTEELAKALGLGGGAP